MQNFPRYTRQLRSLKVHKRVLPNTKIISHIKNCCGHAPFMEELLSEFSDSIESIDSRYFLSRSLILHEAFRTNHSYDRLWGCIPILKRMMESNMDAIWSQYNSVANMFKDISPLDPQLILDFIVCLNDLTCDRSRISTDSKPFKALIRSPILYLKGEHLDILTEMGNDIPECIADVHRNMNSIIKYDDLLQDVIKSLSNVIGIELSKICVCLAINLDRLYPGGEISGAPNNLENMLQIGDGEQGSSEYVDISDLDISTYSEDYKQMINRSTGYLNMEEFRRLLNSLSGTEIPIYSDGAPIVFQGASSAKSARK